MKFRRRQEFFIGLLLFFILAGCMLASPQRTIETRGILSDEVSTSAAPIIISGNGGFAGYAGNGDKTSPYLIEDLVIDGAMSSNCIFIEHTDAYFVIQNCTLYNASNGIRIVNVTHGRIRNNTIHDAGIRGIALSSSDNNTVVNNTIMLNPYGVHIFISNNNTISNNTIKNCGTGIYLEYSDINKILNNTINSNGYGLAFIFADYNEIIGNTLHCNTKPWDVDEATCTGNVFADNDVDDCAGEPIPAFGLIFLLLGLGVLIIQSLLKKVVLTHYE